MKLFNCESPRIVVNPYTGERVAVPCGHCHTCLNRKSFKWVQRLELERACHPYTLFFTLTYSEQFVPKVYYSGVGDDDCFFNEEGEVLFRLNDREQHFPLWSFTKKDWAYLYNREVFYVHRPADISSFIKRLRSKLSYYEPDKAKSQLRYYIVSEYGPTTFRPHYHGLLFFESKWLAENAKEVISSCWRTDGRNEESIPFGSVDVQYVNSSATNYVAQYLNCTTYLPKVYLCKAFRPKALSSRLPPIGTLQIYSEKVREIFDNSATTITLYRRSNNTFVDVPLPSSLENRLFPKFKGFSRIDDSLRIALYRLFEESKVNSYSQFLDFTENYAKQNFGLSSVSEFLCKLACSPSAFKQYYSCLRRISYNRLMFGVSLDTYIQHILQYYRNKDYNCLTQQNIMLSQYSENPEDLYYIDEVLCYDLKDPLINHPLDGKVSLREKSVIPDYIKMVSNSTKIFKDNIKSKKKNDYLKRHSYNKTFNLIKQLYG